ncbi:Gfo/Idh/MocA family oxidoreductase [Blastopirellula sp. JC732]|uniref:Gfo/Idh/MocA family oxidoreductase n=1 Tax=Blastopirellula sediminis TaxID=2894196 RepID=A0A9X1SG44_9BACT|nr:Gfo/Idh/MocA family oxidoreductase [Blastopirellula sediminis]MCC9608952.1 Gfo/Idh/MocA family oxidoreductase [Blastopirellula sediminis]MCC9628271.1 Gfo/Idh/MocA family oxidoreductase [Blastopirellula sediminis]
MQEYPTSRPSTENGRRQFLKTAGLAATGAALLSSVSPVHAAGDDRLKVGLVGCGGRGTGAALQALTADQNVQLTAMADMFQPRLDDSLRSLSVRTEVASKIDVPKERQFIGFDAYKELIASDVDVVLLATPPHFRPMHLKAAIEAGKHVFAEKPVAVDAPGVRSVLESCELAKRKGLSVVSGLCIRYDQGFQEGIERIHDGAIGEAHTIFADDYRGPIWVKTREASWTDMHWQMHNWYYFTWLSGDFNVEQHVHYLDVCAWVLNDYPVKAIGMGGRQVRTDEMYGNIYDHHSVVYEYASGARVVSNCRQQKGCKNRMGAVVQGSRGTAQLSEKGIAIEGDSSWAFTEKAKSMYQVEHDELFASIRAGKPRNDGNYMANSTMMAIMGRMATYTGQEVSWDQAFGSKQDLSPAAYEWGDAPEVIIAQPGITKLI